MPVDTIYKRVATLFDCGVVPYPKGSIDIGARALLTSSYYPFDLPTWQQSYLGRINNALLTALDTLGDTNQEDLAKASFPLYNLYLNPNETLSKPSLHLDITSYRFDTFWEIHCYNKTTDQSGSRYNHNLVLLALLKQVKELLGTNILLDIVEVINYQGSKIIKLRNGGDIVNPQKLVIKLKITHSQQRALPKLAIGEC